MSFASNWLKKNKIENKCEYKTSPMVQYNKPYIIVPCKSVLPYENKLQHNFQFSYCEVGTGMCMFSTNKQHLIDSKLCEKDTKIQIV